MSLGELLDQMRNASAQPVYFSGELDDLQPLGREHCEPLAPFLLHNSSQVQLWLGSAGVVAELHYDAYHNYYVRDAAQMGGSLVSRQWMVGANRGAQAVDHDPPRAAQEIPLVPLSASQR
jgi:hypothetical protein